MGRWVLGAALFTIEATTLASVVFGTTTASTGSSFLGRSSALVWAILGAFFSVVLYLLHEWLRRPDLDPDVLEPSDQPGDEREYDGRPAKRGRWVNVRITNRPLRGWRRRLLVGGRRSALFCRGFWSVSPENGPAFTVPVHWSLDDPTLAVYPALNRLAGTTFLHGGTSEVCNMVAQFNDEAACYLWSADSFGPLANWRKREWELQPGQHRVRLELIYEAGRRSFDFVIRNEGHRERLGVEPAV